MTTPRHKSPAPKSRRWNIERISPNVHVLNLDLRRAGDSIDILLQADEHWDNAHCDRAMLKRHHEEALRIDAPILKFGDTFCAMQGKWDKRSDQRQIRPEHRKNNYLDALVNTAADWYRPYAGNIALLATGNHETSINAHHQTNLTERLAQELGVPMGGYWGYVLIRINKPGKSTAGSKITKHLFYHHGYGGGGEVTRGMIDNNRTRGQYLADVFISGHIHRRNMDENNLIYCTPSGGITVREQIFLRAGTYKEEHLDPSGYHAEKGRAARPKGGWWLTAKVVTGAPYDLDLEERRAR